VTRNEVMNGVQEIVRLTFKVPSLVIRDDTTVDEVDGWDSVAHATVVLRLEKRFNVRLSDEVAYRSKDLGELVDGIARLVGAR
jgi:acyl carrier protein